jgi:hypothetical protein
VSPSQESILCWLRKKKSDLYVNKCKRVRNSFMSSVYWYVQ